MNATLHEVRRWDDIEGGRLLLLEDRTKDIAKEEYILTDNRLEPRTSHIMHTLFTA